MFGLFSVDEVVMFVGEFVDELCLNLVVIVFIELIVFDDVDFGNEGVVEMFDVVCS